MNEMNSDTLNWSNSTWKKVSLPLFISSKNKIIVGAAAFIFSAAFYLFTNHHQFFEPRLLPFTLLDQSIPFLPWTVWVYTSEYTFFIVIYLLCRSTLNLNKYFYALVSLQFVSTIIFMLWPTTYPRHFYPLPADMGSWTHFVFATLRDGDSPVNCAPSLHVSSVILSSLLFLNEQREKLPFFLTWASLIALSTLTTKQHYIVDVVSGLMMALVFHWIFYRKISYHEIKP
jgi:membrane-associated phospholipid phosphatase